MRLNRRALVQTTRSIIILYYQHAVSFIVDASSLRTRNYRRRSESEMIGRIQGANIALNFWRK